MKTAVAYIRVSKLKEDAVSPHSQLQMMRDWCEKNHVQLVEVFRDLDISGREYARHKRDELQRLIDRVRQGDIDYVLCYRFDRFTRGGSRDYYRIISEFDDKAHVVSISENIDTSTTMGEIILNLYLGQAKAESERIGSRIRDNLLHVVKYKRKWIGGEPPFGYALSKTGLVVDPKQAEIVRWIFERYAAGHGARVIARDLNARGVPTSGGGVRWHYSTLANILTSRVYLGEIKWQGEWHPGNHEAIIDQDLWERAQARRRANTHVGSAPKGERVLTGLLRCGICGKPGTIKYGYKGQVRYMCSQRQRVDRTACPNILLDEPSLVDRVREAMRAVVDPERIERHERRLSRAPRDTTAAEIAAIERRLQRIKVLLDRLFVDHYEREAITHEQFVAQNTRYLEEQRTLNERREALQRQRGTVYDETSAAMAVEATDALLAAWEEMEPHERRVAIGHVVREIVWTPERAVLLWQWGERVTLDYDAVPRGTGYFDDRWKHVCSRCGRKFTTGRALSMHLPHCSKRTQ